MSNNELTYLENLINEMKTKEAEMKVIADEVEAVRFLIKETLDNEGLDEVATATHTVKYSNCERTTVDKKTLQAEYPDIFAKVAKISQYKMLRIS